MQYLMPEQGHHRTVGVFQMYSGITSATETRIITKDSPSDGDVSLGVFLGWLSMLYEVECLLVNFFRCCGDDWVNKVFAAQTWGLNSNPRISFFLVLLQSQGRGSFLSEGRNGSQPVCAKAFWYSCLWGTSLVEPSTQSHTVSS